MNDSIENKRQNDVLYRTISFQDSDSVWGYPVPHLMAMQFREPFPLVDAAFSEIFFHFSTERVRIAGEALHLLWADIVVDVPIMICAGEHATKDGKYIIKEIQVVDESAKSAA